ncbi:MAG: hypothetical protein K8T25_10700, partial [Planctomycetia bacterium]|nr:hypothetical protein [Planctomycetia bacterium]
MSRLLNALKKIENRGPGSAADECQEYESTSDVWPAPELEEAEVEVEADETGALPQAPNLEALPENAWDESLDQEPAFWPLTPVEWPMALERFESDETFWSPDGPAVEEYEAEAEEEAIDEAATENIATHRFATQIIEDDDADEIAAMDAADHDVDVVDVTVIEDAANDHDAIAPVA